MASNFPASLDALTNPASTDFLSSPDHATQHINANDIIEAVETTLGTNSGTSILQHFTAGQFPVRATGVAATGTLQQTIVGGTYNGFTAGTPSITGGTYNNFTAGTATVAGTIVLPSTVIPTVALVNNAVTIGSTIFNKASADGTILAGSWGDLGGATGTLAVTVASDLLTSFYVGAFNSSAAGINQNFRLRGTAGAGTFHAPDTSGILIRHATNNERKAVGVTSYLSTIAVGTYICAIQGSCSAGSLTVDPNDWQSASALQLRK